MKHFLFSCATLLMLMGCTDYYVAEVQNAPVEAKVSDQQRSTECAVQYARAIRDILSCRGGRSLEQLHVMPLTNKSSRGESFDTLMYIVEYGEGSGFALISANPKTEPILGYIEDGSYTDMSTAQNPGFQFFMDNATSYVVNTNAEIIEPSKISITPGITPAFRDFTVFYDDSISPKVSVAWGQDYPEGMFCPNLVSGCSQTALGQLLSAIESPTSISLTYPGHPENSNLQLNWTEINKHKRRVMSKNYHYMECDASDYAHETIGYLMRQLGHLNNATYTYDSSKQPITGANITSNRATAYNIIPDDKFSVSSVYEYYNANILFEYIKGGIVLMRGGDSTKGGGHEWLADGGIRVGRIEYHTDYNMSLDGSPVTTAKEYLDILIHYNWGWDGDCNGYFSPNVFSTRDAESYDYSGSYMNCDFSKDIKLFVVSPRK